MTRLQELYVQAREQGLRHQQAVDWLAERLSVDRATVVRVLDRAEKENGRSWPR
jgi:hypothetical protein